MNILLVSKSFIVRSGFEHIIKTYFSNNNIRIKKEISTIEPKKRKQYDIIFIDIEENMHDTDWEKIKEISLFSKVIIIDRYDNKEKFKSLLYYGIYGYILNINEEDELKFIIKQVLKGKKYFDTSVIENIILESNKEIDIDIANLTNREKEVLTMVKQGLTNKSISERMFISENTIKKHISSILSKLSMKNRKELIVANIN